MLERVPVTARSSSCTLCVTAVCAPAARIRRYLPYVGMVTIIMNDYPMLKYGLIAVLAVLVITSKE